MANFAGTPLSSLAVTGFDDVPAIEAP